LAPITSVYKEYSAHTSNGIAGHFQLALGTLALRIPPNFPWSTFYDANERLLQVNQRVPFIADIIVNRPDSKRPPAKKDTDNFLRRLVPAISLQIAQHVAINDLYDDVDAIAVNCWCRYYERTTGRLKNAFVSSLKVEKKNILQIDINKADALDAFRALRGAYVYSTQEIVPIEPQIRLDKKDNRFVEGREVLEGMAQGQNLATMDWQEFEHLIRELLAKEFGRKEGSEIRITRASRDRGVDAVIFDPDPLHGGKSVVQAKRYNNVVDVSAVRDLWGTVLNEGAARGILVTTSKYGRDAYDFVSNKPLVLIDGQNLLALCIAHRRA
jgi:restriction system protein